MRTAKQWKDLVMCKHEWTEGQIEQWATEIQLDAMKEGMRRAAVIAEQNKGKAKQERLTEGNGLGYYSKEAMEEIASEERGENIASHNINAEILSASEQLTEKDL